ncbi:hypothetical protein NDU88_004890 [Pleurodeles waltl]|uniref:Uncharacterized protein n=1 Tax=Pleurodeles waltl TaxID=8319 RepID=A0AAV7TT89_PLEWA|nr:hypothetical protein NDU88_004890 [Pleurodeles waltl]
MQDATTQVLLAVSQLLANINTSAIPAQPISPWSSNDALQNSVAELKRQVEAIAAAPSVTPAHSEAVGPCVTLATGAQPPAPSITEKSKVTELNNNTSVGGVTAVVTRQNTLLSRPGKLAAHVGSDVKEKIWEGEFVDIFSLIKAKRREMEVKDKKVKTASHSDKKPKAEESITNWLFGFNVFMSVMLEKKPELGISMICYANKILKAHHMYGGNSWLDYDRDFRFRSQYSSDKRGRAGQLTERSQPSIEEKSHAVQKIIEDVREVQ